VQVVPVRSRPVRDLLLVRRITIDANACELSVGIDDAEMARRKAAWTPPAPKATSGVLGKYVRLVKSASEGCVTD